VGGQTVFPVSIVFYQNVNINLGIMKILNPAVASVLFLSAIVVGIVVSSSCNKGTPARPELRTNLPVIDSISPKTGAYGTVVTVYGKNLGNSSSVITVNGKAAANTSPSDTKFVITVSDSSSTGPVVVKNTYGQTSGPVFTYIQTLSYKVSVFAGNPTQGLVNGTGTAARFYGPAGIAIDAAGSLIVVDIFNHCVRKITTPGAVVTTVAGTGTAGFLNNTNPLSAQFQHPAGVAIDQQGNIYVTDEFNQCIRKIATTGAVTTFAGIPNSAGSTNGPAAGAQFGYPEGILIDKNNNFYITEVSPSRLRSINTATMTVAAFSGSGTQGAADGSGATAQYNSPHSVALDAANANLYVCDQNNNKIRRISLSTGAVSSPLGYTNGAGTWVDGIGNAAGFSAPCGITSDPDGNFYIADQNNNRIRKVVASTLEVTTLAGNNLTGFTDADGDKATFKNPYGIVRDASGNFYVTDEGNNCIRKITPYKH
jgi:sugar lactone lactonase YvrE